MNSYKVMAKQSDLDKTYLRMAQEWGNLSSAERRKVGALIVRGNQIISDGFNGMPSGMSNACEDAEGYTKREVLHAESNALTKLCKSSQSSTGSTLYVTLSPCFNCAKLVYQAGISRVVYSEEYHDLEGITFLESLGVQVEKI